LFGFTESLELKPECRTSQHEYEEIGLKSQILWKIWFTE